MIAALKRLREQEEGFTLIELMVVVLIMAILMAIAIPTFLGAKNGANDRAAQSNLNTALTSAKSLYANGGSYSTTVSAEVSALASGEPSLTFTTGSSTTSGQIYVNTDTTSGNWVELGAHSSTNTCWYIADIESGSWPSGFSTQPTGSAIGTFYGQGPATSSACSGGTVTWVSGTSGSGFQSL
jgi:type IV pilus assembly protein PilA